MLAPIKSIKDFQEWYPFFPLEQTNNEINRYFYSPLSGKTHQVPLMTGSMLQLCNGCRTWGEIVFAIVKEFSLSHTAVMENIAPVIDSLTDEGILWWRRKPSGIIMVPPPNAILWDITNKCNLRCRHCVVNGGDSTVELDTANCLRLIDELVAFGVKQIIFSGGEPLLRKDLLKLVSRAAEKELIIQIATNASLITPNKAKKLAALGVNAQVSLDGASSEVHDAFRQVPGAWEKTIKGIRQLTAAKIPIMIAATVNRLNLTEIPKLYELAAQLGAHTFRILPFVPYGRGKKAIDLEVSPQEMAEITEYLFIQRQKGGLNIAQMEFECTFFPPPGIYPQKGTHIGCDGGIAYCTINTAGDVLPCNFFSGTQTQNVKDQKFSYIWANSNILNYFRSLTVDDIHGTCQECSWLATCRTSCIAANFAHGDVFQSNCHCWRVAG